MTKKQSKLIYDLCKDLLFYEFCPTEMQTGSLVERIFNDVSDCLVRFELPHNLTTLPEFKYAVMFILTLFNVSIDDYTGLILYNFELNHLLSELKYKARSRELKNYFNL